MGASRTAGAVPPWPPELAGRRYWWWGRPRRGVWLARGQSETQEWSFYEFPVPERPAGRRIVREDFSRTRLRDAFDDYDMHGAWVDRAVGADPRIDEVDKWEAGDLVPSPEQVRRVAWLTQRRVEWFYPTAAEWGGTVFVCSRGRSVGDRRYGLAELDQPDGRLFEEAEHDPSADLAWSSAGEGETIAGGWWTSEGLQPTNDDVAERARARAERLASMPPEWHAEVTRKLYGRERNR